MIPKCTTKLQKWSRIFFEVQNKKKIDCTEGQMNKDYDFWRIVSPIQTHGYNL